MYGKRAEHDGGDHRDSAKERSKVKAGAGPLERARVKMQAGFRRYLAQG